MRKVDLARLEKVSKARVSQWVKEKVIEVEENGLLDRKKVCGQLREWRTRRTTKLCESLRTQSLEEIDFGGMVNSFCKKVGAKGERVAEKMVRPGPSSLIENPSEASIRLAGTQ